MSFTQLPFAILLAVVVALWLPLRHLAPALMGGRRTYWAKLGLLLVASLVFYSHNRWWLLGLIGAYCVVDYAIALWVARWRYPRLALTLGIVFNLSVMAFWKYTPALLRLAADLSGWTHWQPPQVPEGWAIPLGVSFYSFTGIAYMVDVYRRDIQPEQNFLRFGFFMTFFAHLVAGPILRAREFLDNIQERTFPNRPEAPMEAVFLLGRGFFKKMVLADRIAIAIDPYFQYISAPDTAGIWSLPYVYLYALQIYLDFSGYTDIARGLALWFGFRWPDNFNLPYLASSIQDFWRRWHITLSTFLRDYLYIPLGGNRCGRFRSLANLMLTMLLGGLWHGSTWSFMLWGGLHGSYLVVNRLWSPTALRQRLVALTGPAGWLYRAVATLITFHLVCLAWCFFRLTVFSESLTCVQRWFVFDRSKPLFRGTADDVSLWLLLALYAAGALVAAIVVRGRRLPELNGYLTERPFGRGLVWGAAVVLFVLALILAPAGEKPPFIYFQF